MTPNRTPARRSLAAIALGAVASAAAYPWFPNGYLPAFYWPIVAAFLPVTAAAILFSLQSLWNRDAFRDRGAESEATYNAIVFRLVLFVIGLHGLLLGALVGAFNRSTWAPRLVIILFGLLLMSVGNLLPRTRPNLEFGIRTRRTLSDRSLWMRTHRLGGQLAVVLGGLIAVSGSFLSRTTLPSVVVPATLATVATLVISYRWHVRP
jgi:hypothetical protein